MEPNKEQSTFDEFCENTSCQGIIDWHLAKCLFARLFWAILVTTGLAVTIFQTYGTIKGYLASGPYSITVSIESSNDGVPFPFVTVCNYNRAKQSVVNSTNLDPKVLSYFFQLFPTYYDIPLAMLNYEQILLYQQAYDDYVAQGGEHDIRKFFQKYGYSHEDIIMLVTYGGNGLVIQSFTEVFTVYGRCWRITINSSQPVPGSQVGVKIWLNPQLNEYMTDVVFNNYYQKGFAISLSYTDEALISDPISLSPGSAANIAMKATLNTVSTAPFPIRKKPCQNNQVLKIIKAEYTVQNCLHDCYMQSVWNTCGCILLAETQRDLPLCNVSVAINCSTPNPIFANTTSTYVSKVIPGIMKCAALCENPCHDFMTVEGTMSSTQLHIANKEATIPIIQELGKSANWSSDYVRGAVESAVLVNIYFSTLDMNVIETGESVPIMTLISNIGGQLGLFMGISIFTVIQFIYYLVVAFCKKKKHNKQKRKIKCDKIVKVLETKQ